MTDPTELRRLAEAATPGPWRTSKADDTAIMSFDNDVAHTVGNYEVEAETMEADAAYIAAMHPQTTLALLDEIAELRSAVITFCAPWAAGYSKLMGLPPRHIHAAHYDLLEKCGARMVDFVRHDND